MNRLIAKLRAALSSTADLKFLQHLLRTRYQELQIASGTGIVDLLVPSVSEVRVETC